MGNDSKRSISFSFNTPEEKEDFLNYAGEKGMTLSALAKMALFQYRARFPEKLSKHVKTVCVEPGVRTVQASEVLGDITDEKTLDKP